MILGFASLLTNFLLLVISIIFIIILSKQFGPEPEIDLKPECKFRISNPKFEIEGNKKIARFSVHVDNIDKYFLDFPVLFKFYSDYRFKSKIKIIYNIPGDDEEKEVIYDRLLLFEEDTKEHVYYITDIILGSINFEIELEIDYGEPIISFEILENSLCRLTEEYYLEIKFPNKM